MPKYVRESDILFIAVEPIALGVYTNAAHTRRVYDAHPDRSLRLSLDG